MNKILRMFIVISMIAASVPIPAWASVPHAINFQGRLTDASGAPVTTEKQITLRLFIESVPTTSSSTVPVFTETHMVTPDSTGAYSIMIGDNSSLAGVNFNQPLWLELQVTGEPEPMMPRFRLTSSPYALRAEKANSLDISGSLGIGTENPEGKLDVGGKSIFRPVSGDPTKMLVLDEISGAMRIYTDANTGTPGDFILGTYPKGHMNQLVLKQNSGNVGIGTANPGAALDVVGNARLSNSLIWAGSGGTNVFMNGTLAKDNLRFGTKDAERMRITDVGNVGVGTVNPFGRIDVYDPFEKSALVLSSGYDAGANTNKNWAIRQSGYYYGDLSFVESNATGGNPMSAGTARFLIQKVTGNVGIGTANPGAKLEVAGTVKSIGFASTGSGPIGSAIQLINPSKSTAGKALNWNIYNMTEGYGNSLQFWAYDTIGCVSGGLCAPRLVLEDSGDVKIPGGKLDVSGIVNASGYLLNGQPFTGGSSQWSSGTGNISYSGGNVGIGTANPNAKLSILSSNLPPLGTAGGSISMMRSDNNVGMFMGWDGSDFGWIQSQRTDFAGVSQLALQPNGGNVGIGTANPSSKFEVFNGSISVKGANAGISINGSPVLTSASGAVDVTGSTQTKSGGLNVAGRVGIGTTNPSSKFDIDNGSITIRGYGAGLAVAGTVNAQNYLLNGQPFTGGANQWSVIASTFSPAPIFYTGNVSIGTTDPGPNNLKVQGNVEVTGYINTNYLKVNNGMSVNFSGPGNYVSLAAGGPSLGFVQNYDSKAYLLYQNIGTPTEMLNIQSDGHIYLNSTRNVGIGTTNPSSKFEVFNGSITVQGINSGLEVKGGPIKATGGLIIETRTADPTGAELVPGRMWLIQ